MSYLLSKGRITDDAGPEFLPSRIFKSFRIIPISPEIAHLATTLELPHGDPFDRVIAATAIHHRVPLLTRDKLPTRSAVLDTAW